MRSVINEPVKPRPLIRNYFNPRLRGGGRERESCFYDPILSGELDKRPNYRAHSPSIYTRRVSASMSFNNTWINEMIFTESSDAYIGSIEF